MLGESGSFYKVSGRWQERLHDEEIHQGGRFFLRQRQLYRCPQTPFTAKLVNPNGNGIVNFRKAPGLSASDHQGVPHWHARFTVTASGRCVVQGRPSTAPTGYVSRYFFQVVK